MGPVILIVGDRAHRGELVPRVQDLGYSVSPVRARELLLQVARSPGPAAVIVCLGDADASGLVRSLRQSPEGAAVPVLLYGRLQGEIRDLADVLELGAERFLEAPVADAELAAALAELAGSPELTPRSASTPPPGGPARAGDPVLGKLHHTLEVLAARLEGDEEAGGDGIDLEAMGLDAVPDVDREHDSGELELLPETTQRLSRATPERPGTATMSRAGGGRWHGRRELTFSREEEISSRADPRTDPNADRTAPVATAGRDDVRKERSLRGGGRRPGEHASVDMFEVAPPSRSRSARWTGGIEPTARVRTSGGEDASGSGETGRVWVRAGEDVAGIGETGRARARAGEDASRSAMPGESGRVRARASEDARFGEMRSAAGRVGSTERLRARDGEEGSAAGRVGSTERLRARDGEEGAAAGRVGSTERLRARDGEEGAAAGRVGSTERLRARGGEEGSARIFAARGEPSDRPMRLSGDDGDDPGLTVRTGSLRGASPGGELRGMTARTGPGGSPLGSGREPTTRLAAGVLDSGRPTLGLGRRAVGAAANGESGEERVGAGLAVRTGGSASRGAEALPRLGPPRSRGESDAAALLAELRRERFTGCLQVSGQGAPERRLWWSEGQVIGGASAAAEESVLGRLTARGLIGPVQLELAARWSTGDPRRDVERLAQAGLMKPQEMQEALREPVRRVVERIAEAGAVAWALHPGASPPLQVELGVPLAALIASGVRRGAVLSQLREAIGDGRRPRLSFAGPEALAAELRWPEIAAIAGRFDGRTSVGELVAEVIADEIEVRAAVHVLGLLGHLAPEVDDPEASLTAVDRRRVRERLRLARENDYFALLGLSRAATRAEVLRAHADLGATFREGLEPASKVELAAEVEELLAALDEARDVLVDDALRTAYLGQLAAGASAREAR